MIYNDIDANFDIYNKEGIRMTDITDQRVNVRDCFCRIKVCVDFTCILSKIG